MKRGSVAILDFKIYKKYIAANLNLSIAKDETKEHGNKSKRTKCPRTHFFECDG